MTSVYHLDTYLIREISQHINQYDPTYSAMRATCTIFRSAIPRPKPIDPITGIHDAIRAINIEMLNIFLPRASFLRSHECSLIVHSIEQTAFVTMKQNENAYRAIFDIICAIRRTAIYCDNCRILYPSCAPTCNAELLPPTLHPLICPNEIFEMLCTRDSREIYELREHFDRFAQNKGTRAKIVFWLVMCAKFEIAQKYADSRDFQLRINWACAGKRPFARFPIPRNFARTLEYLRETQPKFARDVLKRHFIRALFAQYSQCHAYLDVYQCLRILRDIGDPLSISTMHSIAESIRESIVPSSLKNLFAQLFITSPDRTAN